MLEDRAVYQAMRGRLSRMRQLKERHGGNRGFVETIIERMRKNKAAAAGSRQQHIAGRLKWFAGQESRRLEIDSQLQRQLGNNPDSSWANQRDPLWAGRLDVAPGDLSRLFLENEEYRSIWNRSVQLENTRIASSDVVGPDVLGIERQISEVFYLPGTRPDGKDLDRRRTGTQLMVIKGDTTSHVQEFACPGATGQEPSCDLPFPVTASVATG